MHYLQFESSELNDQEKKEEAEEEVNDEDGDADGAPEPDTGGKGTKNTKFKPKKINVNKIAKYIVGLKTYEATVTDKTIIKYIAFTESHQEPTLNIWIFLC